MVFNATFNNISATMYILAVSFLVEEAGENYQYENYTLSYIIQFFIIRGRHGRDRI
jgi:hypothetical protein